MKKVISLFCVLALTLSANAMPTVKRTAPKAARPIQKAVTADNAFTTPVNFVAINNEGAAGDYQIYLYDANGTLIAMADINTGSNTSLAGVYNVGTEGGQNYSSALYAGGQAYAVNYGSLSLVSRGQSTTTGDDIYDLVASGWEVSDGQNVSTYAFSGTISGYAAWKTYYQNCKKNQTDCDKYRITLTETAPQASVEVSCFDNNVTVDTKTMTGENPYWSLDAAGYVSDTEAYELHVLLYGNQLVGSYTKDEVATYENGTLAAEVYHTTDDGKNWETIELTSVYGTVTKESNAAYRMDFYATDKSNKVYHFIVYYGFNTTDNTIWYDSDADFHAAFALSEMTPFSADNIGEHNGMRYFVVSVKNNNNGADLLFFSNRVDEQIILPAGRYSVSKNEAVGTLQAGSIIKKNDAAYPNPSYAYTIGSKYNTYSFIIDGTADVTNADGNLYIVVKGVNSFYRIVEITIGEAPVTGIETINAAEVEDGKKVMVDGQLYIIRNGVMYNAQGAVVK